MRKTKALLDNLSSLRTTLSEANNTFNNLINKANSIIDNMYSELVFYDSSEDDKQVTITHKFTTSKHKDEQATEHNRLLPFVESTPIKTVEATSIKSRNVDLFKDIDQTTLCMINKIISLYKGRAVAIISLQNRIKTHTGRNIRVGVLANYARRNGIFNKNKYYIDFTTSLPELTLEDFNTAVTCRRKSK